MAVTRSTPLTTTTRATPTAVPRDPPAGASFEAPLYTVPYVLSDCRAACVDTRDLLSDDDLVHF